MAALLALIVGFGVFGLVIFVTAVWRGWVLSTVWGWLVVPLFHLPPLTILGAVTLSLIVGFLVAQDHNCAKDENTNHLVHTTSIAFVYPLVVLIIAFFAKMFV